MLRFGFASLRRAAAAICLLVILFLASATSLPSDSRRLPYEQALQTVGTGPLRAQADQPLCSTIEAVTRNRLQIIPTRLGLAFWPKVFPRRSDGER